MKTLLALYFPLLMAASSEGVISTLIAWVIEFVESDILLYFVSYCWRRSISQGTLPEAFLKSSSVMVLCFIYLTMQISN